MKTLVVAAVVAVACLAGCGPVRQFNPCQKPNCNQCKGTGTYRCTACLGSGYMKCNGGKWIDRGCDAGSRLCSTCNGTGMRGTQQCAACNGRGRKNCTECGGTGRAKCETCEGTGTAKCGDWIMVERK